MVTTWYSLQGKIDSYWLWRQRTDHTHTVNSLFCIQTQKTRHIFRTSPSISFRSLHNKTLSKINDTPALVCYFKDQINDRWRISANFVGSLFDKVKGVVQHNGNATTVCCFAAWYVCNFEDQTSYLKIISNGFLTLLRKANISTIQLKYKHTQSKRPPCWIETKWSTVQLQQRWRTIKKIVFGRLLTRYECI